MIKIMKEWVGPFAILLLKRIRVQNHRLSLSKTIYFNFKCLPFRQACKLPIFIYHNTSIYRIGKIEIKSKEIFQGMIQWGKLGYKSSGKGKICNNGKIEFEGPVFWWGGCILENNGTMVFKGYTQIGEGTLILIRDYLEIGRYTRIGFLSFFMDSDDHFTVNMENQKVARNKAPIIIGKYNWIANKTVIKKNTKTPDYTIVASSNTLLSKDYTENGEFCVLGGIPAKVIAKGIRRIYNYKAEAEINDYFKHNPDCKYLQLDLPQESLEKYCIDNALHF